VAGIVFFLCSGILDQFQSRWSEAKVVKRSLLDSGLPDNSFDCVAVVGGLHHIHPEMKAAVCEIHRVLRPGGVWMVSVPNPYHVKEIIWNLFRVPDRQGHIYSWTRQTISRLGEMNGFRLVDWGGTYFYPPIPAPWWMLARSVAYKFVKT